MRTCSCNCLVLRQETWSSSALRMHRELDLLQRRLENQKKRWPCRGEAKEPGVRTREDNCLQAQDLKEQSLFQNYFRFGNCISATIPASESTFQKLPSLRNYISETIRAKESTCQKPSSLWNLFEKLLSMFQKESTLRRRTLQLGTCGTSNNAFSEIGVSLKIASLSLQMSGREVAPTLETRRVFYGCNCEVEGRCPHSAPEDAGGVSACVGASFMPTMRTTI